MEAIKEIIAQMRKPSIYKGKIPVSRVDADFKYFADKLEAAIAQKPQHGGNTAKMREALEEIIDTINKWRTGGLMEHWQYSNLYDIADAALSAPPRNFEVGTPKEQTLRFYQFCNSYSLSCKDCPCKDRSAECDCRFVWAQLPYEEEADNESRD